VRRSGQTFVVVKNAGWQGAAGFFVAGIGIRFLPRRFAKRRGTRRRECARPISQTPTGYQRLDYLFAVHLFLCFLWSTKAAQTSTRNMRCAAVLTCWETVSSARSTVEAQPCRSRATDSTGGRKGL